MIAVEAQKRNKKRYKKHGGAKKTTKQSTKKVEKDTKLNTTYIKCESPKGTKNTVKKKRNNGVLEHSLRGLSGSERWLRMLTSVLE